MTEQPESETPPPARGVPTDPVEQERWKAEFAEDIMAGERGGVGAPWRNRR